MARTSKTAIPRAISSAVMMVIIAALLIATTFAWFSHNESASAGGMAVTVSDKRVKLADSIKVTRTLSRSTEFEYRREGNDVYYHLYEDGDFALDDEGNKIPFAISGLLPGETVDVTFSYTCTDSLIGESIKASLCGIESDTFVEIDHPDADHSVLGVYKYSSGFGDELGESGWIVDYVSGEDDPVTDSVSVFDGAVWSKVSDVADENYVSVTFRFDFDLEQYYTLKTSTNQLSEKSFIIRELRIEVE